MIFISNLDKRNFLKSDAPNKKLIEIVVGPNGSGKTTFSESSFLPHQGHWLKKTFKKELPGIECFKYSSRRSGNSKFDYSNGKDLLESELDLSCLSENTLSNGSIL